MNLLTLFIIFGKIFFISLIEEIVKIASPLLSFVWNSASITLKYSNPPLNLFDSLLPPKAKLFINPCLRVTAVTSI